AAMIVPRLMKSGGRDLVGPAAVRGQLLDGWAVALAPRSAGRPAENGPDGAQQDHDVQPERPTLDVGVVEAGSLRQRCVVAAQPVHPGAAGSAHRQPEPGA